MRLHQLAAAVLTANALGTAALRASNGDCSAGFTLCTSSGATSNATPQIGTAEFQGLFVDIVSSSLPSDKRFLSDRDTASQPSLCCISTLSCLTMATLEIPFCYDKFTTDYYLPDGSYGTVVGGAYTSADGSTANLETGDYTLHNGSMGNIYSSNGGAKPNTAILPMPIQFTASGVGTAVPPSGLGGLVTLTLTTTLPGTTIPPSTVAPSTILGIVTSEPVLLPLSTISMEISNSLFLSTMTVELMSPLTLLGATVLGTTIPGTTVEPVTTTITTAEVTGSIVSTPLSNPSSSLHGPKKSNAVGGWKTWTMPTILLVHSLILLLQTNH
ncbi:hypothetical protein M430DRAFT_25673 [Amorphotheca resinae ATCC 22711]|uniref:Uncharacterized protein n=1 Tax=Amorphotheca resinae ATCC 22711 TaxID=857342 RepID=A0A2T3BC71_AMORE|nr:hypothetical protein M430DRAFT_25673 [Amorphotheca resinae ATCC 22711]PSS25937.1 hypothetical protein M430DRAFT_25673 [Amorphotheca resinae ATCC 22711]